MAKTNKKDLTKLSDGELRVFIAKLEGALAAATDERVRRWIEEHERKEFEKIRKAREAHYGIET